jgi:hypothetical protein
VGLKSFGENIPRISTGQKGVLDRDWIITGHEKVHFFVVYITIEDVIVR